MGNILSDEIGPYPPPHNHPRHHPHQPVARHYPPQPTAPRPYPVNEAVYAENYEGYGNVEPAGWFQDDIDVEAPPGYPGYDGYSYADNWEEGGGWYGDEYNEYEERPRRRKRQDPVQLGATGQGESSATYPMQDNCKMVLYQDAIYRPGDIPRVPGYRPSSCWDDVWDCFERAERFIYISGWSVKAELSMVRHKPGTETLGELLIRKANSGVTVMLLIWDDFLSVSRGLSQFIPIKIAQTGIMDTFDESTKLFFEKTRVKCRLVYRMGQTQTSAAGRIVPTRALYTHHQKTICCDVPLEGGGGHRVAAFVGGLDLTAGRYDTPQHCIFRTLGSLHKDDIYQKSVAKHFRDFAGPRQPWHDIHCRVEGPVALDVMRNFESRWRRQCSDMAAHLAGVDNFSPMTGKRSNGFSCQLLRSIDHNSADDVTQEGGVEKSIYFRYLNLIEMAQKCIYIENQFFFGSVNRWMKENGQRETQQTESTNDIPGMLVDKIKSKIAAGEEFAVYIIVPLHPEGPANEVAAQEMLRWQFRTIDMMYTEIGEAIRLAGLSTNPHDYLNIFCLGNREPDSEADANPMGRASVQLSGKMVRGYQKRMIRSRRHMIYVHSKLMIVDDEHIIVGSANINQRSMAGDRDTEIAVWGHQPKPAGGRVGTIQAFRMGLWAEHLGIYHPLFLTPSLPETVRWVWEMASANWESFADNTVLRPMKGHLMLCPYEVDPNTGRLKNLDPYEYIPDWEPKNKGFIRPQAPGAKITGKDAALLPNVVTA